MTPLAAVAVPDIDVLRSVARTAGLRVDAAAGWPETPDDTRVRPLAGFIESTFSPLVAEVAERALSRRGVALGGGAARDSSLAAARLRRGADANHVTAVIVVTAFGDVTSAAAVALAVDKGARVGPLMFFQSVPNSIAGYLAARWDLHGPVVCVSRIDTGLEIAAGLLEDADADEALVVWVELAADADGLDRAAAVVVSFEDGRS
jgi:hypothetical protein